MGERRLPMWALVPPYDDPVRSRLVPGTDLWEVPVPVEGRTAEELNEWGTTTHIERTELRALRRSMGLPEVP